MPGMPELDPEIGSGIGWLAGLTLLAWLAFNYFKIIFEVH